MLTSHTFRCITFAALLSVSAAAQTHRVDAAERVTRAVAVYEWTGDLAKPTAARLVPVSLFIDGELKDAGTFYSRPWRSRATCNPPPPAPAATPPTSAGSAMASTPRCLRRPRKSPCRPPRPSPSSSPAKTLTGPASSALPHPNPPSRPSLHRPPRGPLAPRTTLTGPTSQKPPRPPPPRTTPIALPSAAAIPRKSRTTVRRMKSPAFPPCPAP
jgi:hypothetical protein